MPSTQESLISGLIAVVIGIVVTVVVAQIIAPPWDLVGALIAVAVASFSAGFFGHYYADDPATPS